MFKKPDRAQGFSKVSNILGKYPRLPEASEGLQSIQFKRRLRGLLRGILLFVPVDFGYKQAKQGNNA